MDPCAGGVREGLTKLSYKLRPEERKRQPRTKPGAERSRCTGAPWKDRTEPVCGTKRK